jgi:hypothetical protein
MQVTGGLKSSGEGKKKEKKNLLILGRTIDPKHMAKFNAFLKLKCRLDKFQDPIRVNMNTHGEFMFIKYLFVNDDLFKTNK